MTSSKATSITGQGPRNVDWRETTFARDRTIVTLTEERNRLEARVAELEAMLHHKLTPEEALRASTTMPMPIFESRSEREEECG